MTPVVLALALAPPALGVDVAWRGDARCSEHGFQDSLARYLAGAAEPRRVRVEVTVRREGEGRWSATLELETAGARSTRTLGGRSCAAVSDAAAFVTAVVADPDVLARAGAAIVPAPDGPGVTNGAGEAGEADMSAGAGDAPGSGGMSARSGGVPGSGGMSAGSGDAPGSGGMSAGSGDGSGSGGMSAGSGDGSGSGRAPAGAQGLDGLGTTGGADGSPGTWPIEEVAAPDGPGWAGASRGPRGFVRLAGGLEALGMPRVGPQAGLAGGALGRGWRVELTAIYRAPTTQFSAVVPTAGARVRMWAIGARGCGVPRAGRVEFPLCAGFEVGQAIGEGVGFAGARSDRFVWAAAVLGPAVAWAPRRWLALWLGADLGVPLVRGTFQAAGLGEVFEIAPVSLRAALGLELRFGGEESSGRRHRSAASRETTAEPP